jgi:hypothetical protein
MSTMSIICSQPTGQISMQAPQVVQAQTASGADRELESGGLGLGSPSAKAAAFATSS